MGTSVVLTTVSASIPKSEARKVLDRFEIQRLSDQYVSIRNKNGGSRMQGFELTGMVFQRLMLLDSGCFGFHG